MIAVIGGGPAGMMAAITAARMGKTVHLFEKNEKLGKKLYITGKGRCNVTNHGDMEQLFGNVMKNPKFLYSAFYTFDNIQTMEFFEELGVPLKVERGERVFPCSDKSSDVIAGLQRELKRLQVKVHYHSTVKKIEATQGRVVAVQVEQGGKVERIPCSSAIVATGGLSYPVTGSTGDGYRFAKEMGHKVTKCVPALVPFEITEAFVKEMQGLSLRNVAMQIYAEKKKIYDSFGEMIFTHFGISGPLVLSGSSYVLPYLEKGENLRLSIDCKPALQEEQLDQRILRDFKEAQNKQFKNSLDKLLPKKMIPVMIQLSGIDPEKPVHSITKEERKQLLHTIKNLEMHICGVRGFQEAIITRGGIAVKEVDPGTMESLLVQGVYFTGEVLDLDALTGGYNLQIAWSTAYMAGMAAQ